MNTTKRYVSDEESKGEYASECHSSTRSDQHELPAGAAVVYAQGAQVAWVFEYGAVGLPFGHPSRITQLEIYDTSEEATKAAASSEFACVVYPVLRQHPDGMPDIQP